MSLVRTVARPLLAVMFIHGGLEALRAPGKRVERAAPLVDKLAEPLRLPNDPELLVRANGVLMMGAGTLLALGKMPRTASTILAAALVPTTIAGHPFWEEHDPAKRAPQVVQFEKNLGLLGGLILAAVDTEGRPGLRHRAGTAGDAAGRAARTTKREARHAVKSAKREAKLAALQARDAIG